MGGQGSGVTTPLDKQRWVNRGNRRCMHCDEIIFRMEPGGPWRHMSGDCFGLYSCDYRVVNGTVAEPRPQAPRRGGDGRFVTATVEG